MRRYIEKMFFKSPIMVIALCLFFVIPYAIGIFFLNLQFTGFELLYVYARMSFYICFALICIAYHYISSANRNYVKEVTDSAKSSGYYEKKALGMLLGLVVAWNIGIIVILVVTSLLNDGTNYFLGWFLPVYLCNVFLPQIICLLFTFLVAESNNIVKWLIMEILFLFMSSPFSESVVWKEKPDFPIDQIWNKIHRLFAIFYENSVWAPDVQGALQTENVRVYLQIFWILLFLTIIIIKLFGKKVMGGIVFGCATVLLIASYQPASLYRLNSSWDGMMYDYHTYMEESDWENINTEEAFQVTSYNMEIELKNELQVKASLTIQPEGENEEFIFTLYRGYEVSSVSCEGEEVSFLQDGDVIKINYPSKGNPFTICICYAGHSNKFYSNSKQAMLPGWFAWYPMTGKRKVFDVYEEYGLMYGYNPYNRIESVDVCLTCNTDIVTNLPQTGKNTYSGKTNGITILSGNIVATDNETIINYLPFALAYKETAAEYVKWEQEEYENVLKSLHENYGVDITEWKNKKIIIASKDLSRNMTNNEIAVFEDYILTTPYGLTEENIIKYLWLKDSENADLQEIVESF